MTLVIIHVVGMVARVADNMLGVEYCRHDKVGKAGKAGKARQAKQVSRVEASKASKARQGNGGGMCSGRMSTYSLSLRWLGRCGRGFFRSTGARRINITQSHV